jgi:hypothetical protein
MYPVHAIRNLKHYALPLSGLLLALGLTYVFAHSYRSARTGPSQSFLANPAGGMTDNAGTDSQKFPDPAATRAIPDLVQFPSAETELIAGPQLKANSTLNPFPLFDSIAVGRGLLNAKAFPSVPALVLTGSLSVSRGSAIVNGTGTRFTAQVDPAGPAPLFNGRLRIRDADGVTMRLVQVSAVLSDSQLSLSTPWPYQSVTSAPSDTYYQDSSEGWNFDAFINRNYYDLALCLYINYYRTGDARFLSAARKVADAWFKAPFCKEGLERSPQNWLPPRSISLGGLMLRALDGRPEMWDWINFYVRSQFNHLVMEHLSDNALYGGARESGYMLLYAAWLARVMPDTYPLSAGGTATDGAAIRATYLSNVESAAVNYYARIQYPDGSWRWDDPYQGEPDGGTLKMMMQPFMVGLLLEGMIAVHRVSQSASVRSVVQSSIVKACEDLYNVTYRGKEAVQDMPGKRWRSQWYYYYGGTTVNPNLYERGGSDAGALVPVQVKGDVGTISSQRQLNSTVQHAFGYAYRMTGEEQYRVMGDEMMEAGFGNSDGIMGMADSDYSQPKAYDMNYRAAGKFLAWRLDPASALPAAQVKRGQAVTLQAVGGTASDSILTAFKVASELSASSGAGGAQVKDLLNRIESALAVFNREKERFVMPEKVVLELQAALGHTRTALKIIEARSATSDDTAQLRLEWAAARLKRAADLLKRKGR